MAVLRFILILPLIVFYFFAHADTFTVCNPDQIKSFDLHQTYDVYSEQIQNSLYEPLFRFSKAGLIPVLAASWKSIDNGLKWQIKLKKNVSFQSNAFFKPSRPLNAKDVVFSFERQMPGFSSSAVEDKKYEFYSVTFAPLLRKVTALADDTVEFQLHRPKANFLTLLTKSSSAIYSLEYFEFLKTKNQLESLALNPIGTGPWKSMLTPTGEEGVWLTPFEGYHGKKVNFDLQFMAITDPEKLTTWINEKRCHWVNSPPPEMYQKLVKESELVVQRTPSQMMAVIYVNTLMPQLSDAQLRRDLRASLNIDTLIKNHYFGYAEKAFQGVHKRDSYFVQEPTVRYALSGVKREKIPSINLLAPEEPRPYLPAPLETAKEICQQLAPLVNECTVKQLPIQRLARKKASDKDYEFILLGDTTYDSQLLTKDLLCPGVTSESSRTGICVEPMNSLAKSALSTDMPDDELKKNLLNAFREHAVILPLWYAPKLVFYSKLKVNVVDQTDLLQTWLHSP